LPDAASERYALAALAYETLTGERYLDFSPQVAVAYGQILGDPPLPFTRRGFESWPATEAVLRRALAKSVDERHPSTAALLGALRSAGPPSRVELDGAFERRARSFVERFVPADEDDLPPLRSLFERAPIAAADQGATGFAWFLYRLAVLRDRPDLLALADLWCQRAAAAIGAPDAFHTPPCEVEGFRIDACSILHRAPGVHYVHALVCQARADLAGMHAAIQAFLAASAGRAEVADATLGRAGALLAATTLLEAASAVRAPDAPRLVTAVEDGLGELLRALAAVPSSGLIARQPLSFAHGWVGVLYAALRAAAALGRTGPGDLPASLRERLAETLADLCAAAETIGRAAPGSGGSDWIPGWCNGTAGHVPLLLLASEILRDERLDELAEQAATRSASHPDRHGHLCCGIAGRVLALLHMYRHTGRSHWLDLARSLARHLVDPLLPEESAGRTHGLFWGALGAALALEELAHPEWSSMPLFGDLGWPRPQRAVRRAVRNGDP
jgi:serine/threonine-protein kinase